MSSLGDITLVEDDKVIRYITRTRTGKTISRTVQHFCGPDQACGECRNLWLVSDEETGEAQVTIRSSSMGARISAIAQLLEETQKAA